MVTQNIKLTELMKLKIIQSKKDLMVGQFQVIPKKVT